MIPPDTPIPSYLSGKVDELIDRFVIYKNLTDQERSERLKRCYDEYFAFLKDDTIDCSQEEKEKLIEKWYEIDKNRLHDSKKFVSDEFLEYAKAKSLD